MKVDRNIPELTRLYLSDAMSAAEWALLRHHLENDLEHPDFTEALHEAISSGKYPQTFNTQQLEQLFEQLAEGLEPAEPQPIRRAGSRRYWWAAAAILVLVSVFLFWPSRTGQQMVEAVEDIAPGSSKAVLILADGSSVTLDSSGNRVLRQGATAIRQQGGQLTYHAEGNTTAESYNTLHIPRGGLFRITLPDGTRVWLNSESTLRYPVAFTGTERKVDVTGEAYFEVERDADKPFLLSVNGQATVQVLGTRFNVNAYKDEEVLRTSLLDGSVRVVITDGTGSHAIVLEPGQQALISNETDRKIHLLQPDMEKVLAWKNGFFNFEGATLQEVMRQVARWYDVEVEYEGDLTGMKFLGEINRNISLQGFINSMQKLGVHCRLEGKKLVVQPPSQ